MAHQLPGGTGSLPCSKMLCQRQEKHYSVIKIGKHHNSGVCEQTGRNGVSSAQSHSQRTVVEVYKQGHHLVGGTSARCSQHNSRRGGTSDEGSFGLDVEPTDLLPNPGEVGSSRSGHVRIQADKPAGEIFQLETRSRDRGSGCLQSGLGDPVGEGLCQPSLEPSRESIEQSIYNSSK